jgi:hypothetical protein
LLAGTELVVLLATTPPNFQKMCFTYIDTDGAMPSLQERSLVFREFRAECEEIDRHKWLESEKAGYDIGMDRARTDWVVNHSEQWRAGRRKKIKG